MGGAGKGLLRRHCTGDFKVNVIQKWLRQHKAVGVIQWIGISSDEAHRMKESKHKWITNIWPLVERRMSRSDCLKWMEKRGYPTPPRSSCVFCPYHNDAEWRRLKAEEPEAFERAVKFEKAHQVALSKTTTGINGIPFLHRSCKPIDQVDFDASKPDWIQENLFGMGQECEGMCGV